MKEEIKDKADKLGQIYFPDECNVWARDNIEAKFVSYACIEMAEWMQRKMIDKACEWLESELKSYLGYYEAADFCDAFRKTMEDVL